jgi:hypothetical protein
MIDNAAAYALRFSASSPGFSRESAKPNSLKNEAEMPPVPDSLQGLKSTTESDVRLLLEFASSSMFLSEVFPDPQEP